MSKKIMKRSLALGALMAFVITGSAMAADLEISSTQNFGELTPTVTGSDILTLGGGDGVTTWWLSSNNSTNTVKDFDSIVYSGEYYESNVTYPESSVFVASNNSTLKIEDVDKIITSGNKNDKVVFFNGFGGHIDVNVNSVDISNVENGIVTRNGGSVTINATENINVSSRYGAVSVYPSGESDVTLSAKNITLSAPEDMAGINVRGSDGSSVTITATETLTVTGSRAINVGGSATGTRTVSLSAENIELIDAGGENDYGVMRATNGTITAEATGKMIVTGDVSAEANSTISLGFGKDGLLTGAVTTVDGSTTNINLGTNSTWTATGDSVVTNVTGDGTVKVDMVSDSEVATVNITNDASGVTTVGATSDVTDYLASLSGEEQERAMEAVAKSVTDAEGKAVTDIVTTDEGMLTGAYTLKNTEDGVVATQAVNTKSDAVSDAGMALKGHWRAHMNDMNKRMGDLRMANGETGVWTRMVRGESEYQGAKMQYNQYQLGYDEKLSVDKRWTVGAAVTFSEGDANYGSGSTDDKSTAFAIYGSKLNNDGTFVDLIARYARLESDLDDRNYGTGDYDTNGYSVSAEFGKRIAQGNGLWIEPQVELTYGTVDSADVAFSGNYKAHYDSMDSFIARAGFALGKDIKQGNVYARASYLYDFDGETETQFEGGKAISEDFGGGWWEVGVGANINLSKATYIYADVEKTFGGEVDTNWQWNLGVRYSF